MVLLALGTVLMDIVTLAFWGAELIPPSEPKKGKPLPVLQKGCCKHCGKKIGRGLHFHEKACKT